ncbi:MAG: VIT1/CCC1 transporter family protein [Streptosporangiaceae bacterium]
MADHLADDDATLPSQATGTAALQAGWSHGHRDVSGGWLRPTVFGAVDGLVTNTSLIAGVGGGGVSDHAVVLTGVAALVAGAFSMGTGEYVSVTNQNELVLAEVELERRMHAEFPAAEQDELAGYFRSYGADPETADRMAIAVSQDPGTALRVHTREELGVDPNELPSPLLAGSASLLAFSLGRAAPRSALVEALPAGRITETRTLRETAEILRISRRGPYVVVAAEVPELGRQAMEDIEQRLRAEGFSSAWRLLPDLQVGVVVLRGPRPLERLIALLSGRARHRVGISPQYSRLDQTLRGLRFARIAMSGAPPGTAQVTVFDRAPLAVTAASSPEVMTHVVGAVLGRLNRLPAADRAVLLDTLEAWRDCGGSATQAADRLFCHPHGAAPAAADHRGDRPVADRAAGRGRAVPALEAARQQPAR